MSTLTFSNHIDIYCNISNYSLLESTKIYNFNNRYIVEKFQNYLAMQETSSNIPASSALSPRATETSSSSILRVILASLGAPLQMYVTIPLDSSICIIPASGE